MLGAKVIWAQDAHGEIGKRQADPPNTASIDLLKPTWLEASAAWAKANKNRLTGAK